MTNEYLFYRVEHIWYNKYLQKNRLNEYKVEHYFVIIICWFISITIEYR